MYYDFSTTTHGKWIVAGEHAVLRGHGALVFPIKNKHLTLNYQKSNSPADSQTSRPITAEDDPVFWRVLARGFELLNVPLSQCSGTFYLENTLPAGVGMGASAALCVALTRWFTYQGYLTPDKNPAFARQLEDLFHGQSSGLDIAGVAADHGIYFQKGQTQTLIPQWKPHWALSCSGETGITSECIAEVNQLWKADPLKAQKLDNTMQKAVLMAKKALAIDALQSLPNLAKAIRSAHSCFEAWGLISEKLATHLHTLRQSGALAVKPTGSGKGGYVLSLWDMPPPANLTSFLLL